MSNGLLATILVIAIAAVAVTVVATTDVKCLSLFGEHLGCKVETGGASK